MPTKRRTPPRGKDGRFKKKAGAKKRTARKTARRR